MFKAIRGTKDILPQDISFWQKIEDKAREIFSLFGYQEIRTPILEEANLFDRSLGKFSEIIQKQMFKIRRDKDIFVLRPEATASVVRAYIENHLDKKDNFLKVYYLGPMFRAERPQKGRLRQFHHLGIEAIGSSSPYLDIEVISLARQLLESLGIKDFKINLNSLGCIKDKQRLQEILKTKLKSKLSKLCLNCKDRFKRNVFRVLDCKNQTCRKIVMELDLKDEHLCPDCRGHFKKVNSGLKALGIQYQYLPQLVRGLDYYTRTIFEITHKDLGGQDALGAGGRYDNLIKELGGRSVPAIGFALGIERILLVKKSKTEDKQKKLVYLITLGDEAKNKSLKLLDNLRKNKIQADTDYQDKSIKGALRRANDLDARFVIIIGEDELKKNGITLKDMISGQQQEIKTDEVIDRIKKC